MASELKVNKISPESGTTLTLGDSGDTINFGSGVLPNFENLTVTGDLTVDTNSLKVDSTNNFVGIGTATPSVALDVVGAITATGNITGTLATAAQPNITSVGTLSSLSVSGNITGTLATASQPNITSLGTLTGLTTTGDINLGDSDKINFGASNDLQIYHDGSNSYISDVGTGNLNIRGTNLVLEDSSGNDYIVCTDLGTGGNVSLKYGAVEKLATTANGVDVSGNLLNFVTPSVDQNARIDLLEQDGASALGGFVNYNGANNRLEIGTVLNGTDTTHLTLPRDGSGNVGIKNSSPSHTLDISDTSTTAKTLRVGQSSGVSTADATMIISNGGTGSAMLRFDYEGTNTDRARIGITSSGQNLQFFTAGNNERMRITSAGLVGIGTSSPTRLLTIADTGGTYMSFDDSAREFLIGSESNQFIFYDQGSSAYRMAISQTGNVVIGSNTVDTSGLGGTFTSLNLRAGSGYANIYGQTTATTTNKTAIGIVGATSGASAGGAAELLGSININCESDSSTNATGFMQFYIGSGGGLSEAMRIDSSGNVLVGKTSQDSGATVGTEILSGRVFLRRSGGAPIIADRDTNDGEVAVFKRGGTTVGSVSVTSSGTTYNTTSDYRLKDNIEIITDGTERLMKLKPVRHSWKESSVTVDGFLAHEVQEAGLEYAVTGEKDGKEMQSMDYGRITPILVSALQNAINEINNLKQQIQKLEVK